jgi:Golgi nucleoside diphosphatase
LAVVVNWGENQLLTFAFTHNLTHHPPVIIDISLSVSCIQKRLFIMTTATTMTTMKHPVEDEDSFALFQERHPNSKTRRLKHHSTSSLSPQDIERRQEREFWKQYKVQQHDAALLRQQAMEQHELLLHDLYDHPGIGMQTAHGLLLDAGSTGTRLHVFEWEPRVLRSPQDIQAAVAGTKLSFPGTDSRWTDRLQPGLSTFASIPDDMEMQQAIAEYLQPLIDFATTVLHEKRHDFGRFPIFLRATAGMRILEADDRARVMHVVRQLFHNDTYCPFAFEDEQARTISGEEEAIFDWAGVNFLMNDLIENSAGAGTVINPRLTHGALDLGGGSTQISFYEPREDIMSNLFKLQIGQAKHWNVYAHSFLFYGMNEAIHRFYARLASEKTSKERLVDGVYNPCLPRGGEVHIRTDIHVRDGVETWEYTEAYPSGNGNYQAMFKNDYSQPDVDACMGLAMDLLHLEKNDWCNFAHKNDCSLAGIYQPELPTQDNNFGEFLAFSNYYHVWKFLKLPQQATIAQLENATRYTCSLSHDELLDYVQHVKVDRDQIDTYCFRSAYVFNLLHHGYGFKMTDTITATNVINGHKVGWALGAMLYEINALPWSYEESTIALQQEQHETQVAGHALFIVCVVVAMFASLLILFVARERRNRRDREYYEPVKEVDM